jgi:Uri superfamily endonuclease
MNKGIYLLLISISKSIRVNVGALGDIHLDKGMYAYVGSAQNNLEKRVSRHLRRNKLRFWHIDYLLSNVSVSVNRIFSTNAAISEECEISRELAEKALPIEGFGCSDCDCESHLFRLKDDNFLAQFTSEMRFDVCDVKA